ncbi:MAG TPA: hypothetical protein V6D15_07270 [Oculatellaceae cyanobacterium]|jgi:formylglycine-generating enzyme required for sulfatase activity
MLLSIFEFDIVTVDSQGNINNCQRCQAEYFPEDLGNGVTLEMVSIPVGNFLMGSPDTEAQRYDRITVTTTALGFGCLTHSSQDSNYPFYSYPITL